MAGTEIARLSETSPPEGSVIFPEFRVVVKPLVDVVLRFTVPLKPRRLSNNTEKVPVVPANTVPENGTTPTLKSGPITLTKM